MDRIDEAVVETLRGFGMDIEESSDRDQHTKSPALGQHVSLNGPPRLSNAHRCRLEPAVARIALDEIGEIPEQRCRAWDGDCAG